MLRSLLVSRFNMSAHWETRQLQTFALGVTDNGPKFRVSKDEGQSVERLHSRLTREYLRTTMGTFPEKLSDAMQAPVRDETALTGKYDFTLDLTPFLPQTGDRPDIGGMMLTALREQLGLRLIPRRGPVEVLVIDRLAAPSPN